MMPLNFDLGYAFCEVDDFTDVAPFDGLLVYVLNMQIKDQKNVPSLTVINNLKPLYGPVPLNKIPNVKGKGSWKYIGRSEVISQDIPSFKDTNQIITLRKATDWATVGGWRKRNNFHSGEDVKNYEDVRKLEMLTLYDMRSVEVRASMHFLLLNNRKVEDYYDLAKETFRELYLQMVNTSFDKKSAEELLSLTNMKKK